MTVREVLVPTDFSECGEAALPHAVAWARRHRARLHVLHVGAFDPENPFDPAHHVDDAESMWAELRERAEEEIGESLARVGPPDLDVVRAVERAPSPARGILDYADRHAIDLVVMGTHGRRGFRSLLIGSVTEEVIREAAVPVLAVRERELVEPPVPPSRIVVPLDFSDAAVPTVRTAREIAAPFHAELLLLHVIEEVLVPDFYYPAAPALYGPELRSEAGDRLHETFVAAGGPAVRVTYHVIGGRAALDIPRFVEEHAADLVVMPTHGLSGVERLLLGSTTDKVLRRAACPVLVLPGRTTADEGEP